jgi:hypothetical protein
MKSKLTICQACSGIGKGWSSPGNFPCSTFAYWQIWQCWTKCCTEAFKFGQANKAFTLLYVTVIPEWPSIPLSCRACNICCCASLLLPTQTRPLNRITPSINWKPFLSLPFTLSSVSSYRSSGYSA